MEKKPLNTESILNQFALVERSIDRAKIPFEVDMLHEKCLEVSVYELVKSIKQMENIVAEIKASMPELSNEQVIGILNKMVF